MDLEGWLRRPEGKTLEFKRDLSSPEPVLRTIVAFANTAGGILVVGVENTTRHVRGVPEPLNIEERLTNLISDHIEPRLLPDIEILPWRRSHVVAVRVYPSPLRPHHLRRQGEGKGTYVRVGSSNRRADDELIAELRRVARSEGFDEQPMADLDSEAVDFLAASQSFAPVRKLGRRDLETLRLVAPYQGRLVPTVGGIVLFGLDRARYFPDAWIQAGLFGGADRARLLDHVELRGYPVAAIEQAITFVSERSRRGAHIGPVKRQDIWEVPPVALREAVVNAVVHADYGQRGAPIRIAMFDDRIEVESPGLLPFGLTVEDLRRGISKLRNRVIGRIFHELGLIEQWGSGIQRMTAACLDSGLASPDLEEIGLRFRVTIHTKRIGPFALDSIDQAIVSLLQGDVGLTTAAIASQIGRTPRATRTRLAALVRRRLLTEVGSGPRDPTRRYFSTVGP